MLALGDLTGRTVIAELLIEDDEGHMVDGTDVRAAVGVLQRIGVTTVILTAHEPESVPEALDMVAPVLRRSRLAYPYILHGCAPETTLYNTEVFLPVEHDDEARLLQAIDAQYRRAGGAARPR